MQITKKQLKSIIAEEMEVVSKEADQLESLLESYVAGYESDAETVDKEALIDFLNVLQESHIPLAAFEAFMQNLPEQSVTPILKEVVDSEE